MDNPLVIKFIKTDFHCLKKLFMHHVGTLMECNGSNCSSAGTGGRQWRSWDWSGNQMDAWMALEFLHLNQQEMELCLIIHTAPSSKSHLTCICYLCFGLCMYFCVCVWMWFGMWPLQKANKVCSPSLVCVNWPGKNSLCVFRCWWAWLCLC